jgi:16S rRNA (guanine527-N7)-methyltransferase
MDSFRPSVLALLGKRLTAEQLRQFEIFERELRDWNRRVNLTAITDPAAIWIQHFLDSLSCWIAMKDSPGAQVVDVGTGAGFPGLPLKILEPSLRLTLVEATGKKAVFCRHLVERLDLRHVQVLHARAEAIGQDPAHRERYDWSLGRAVADLPVLLEYLLPLTRIGGAALAQKGEDAPSQAQGAARALSLLGGELSRVIPVDLPGVVQTRHLVVVRKVASTPAQFPRRSGIPAKRPLV